ncbi:hydrogen peroxide-inducible genes activator [uncultured Tateyamaria sp.]|uniref:hydrogen peroxide-inducible genes activator n=1 Tax=uncultured Tateyamaria sp. TaxID=455651 RepID=UPI002623A374|nr:hydrogen peroxide-inducible genes activator [uncultured Tateyamaria sp.]
MESLTLRQLRYFDALAHEGHFGRAADRCAVSQPALSVQIKDLEASVGFALFERGSRGVRLTSMGETFAVRARDILRGVADLGDWAATARSGRLDRLRLGVIPTIAPYLLPNLIGAFAKAHPSMDMHVRETVTPRLMTELSEGLIDAALVALPLDDTTLTEVPLFEEQMVLVQHESRAGAPIVSAEALADMRLLLLEEGHCFRDQALSFCNINPRRPREGLDGSSLSTLVQMVGAGIGVTLIPDMAVSVETRSAPVCITRFRDPAPTRTIALVWRKTNPMGNTLRAFADVIRDVVA